MDFEPRDLQFKEKVGKSFASQELMLTIGAELARVEPGRVDIQMSYNKRLTQQNGFIHAGIISAIADSACGYAAYSLMPPEADVLSVEFKVNLLSPAIGESFLAEARVIRPGRTLSVVVCEVHAMQSGTKKTIAAMQATMMCLPKSSIEDTE